MKKKLLTIAIFIVVLVVTGCSNKENRCELNPMQDGVVLPDECDDCQWYSVAPRVLSTEYNMVADIREYYVCHRGSLEDDLGDTLGMSGWLYWGNVEAGEWVPDYMIGKFTNLFYFTDREDHSGESESIPVFLDSVQYAKFQENNEDFLVKKWYIKGILYFRDLHMGGCCSLEPVLLALDYDTANVRAL